jgi:hypothetical protein
VTSTEGRSGYPQSLTVVAFAGASGVGSSTGNSGNNSTPGVSLVTTRANSLVFGVGEDPSHARARTLGTNQIMIHEWVDTAGDDSLWVQARNGSVAAAGTTVQVNDTAPTNDRWNLAAVEIVFP